MTNNYFGGGNIRVNRFEIEKGLGNAKKDGHLNLEYSKIKCFSKAFVEAAEGKDRVAKYDLEELLEKARRDCNISSIDINSIGDVLMGNAGD